MPFQKHFVEAEIAGRTLTIETGTLAPQANAAVTVRYGDTMVLVTTVRDLQPRESIDFFPLLVDFEEKMYAAGKIPGSRWVRREGRPSELAVLTGRLIDRSIRPLFPDSARNDVQIVVTSLSADDETFLDLPGVIGASAALTISDIPFDGPIAAAKVGRVKGEFVLNPTYAQLDESDMDVLVTGRGDKVLMIEVEAKEVAEEDLCRAFEFACGSFQPVLDLQLRLRDMVGREKRPFTTFAPRPEVLERLKTGMGQRIREGLLLTEKDKRDDALNSLRTEAETALAEPLGASAEELRQGFDKIVGEAMRSLLLEEGRRCDGRGLEEIRPLSAEVSVLPRVHGSALFQRGETQVLTTVTLGAMGDEKLIDGLGDEESKHYLHHYNFPPYSTGEVKPMRGPGRREVGHGALAEKALVAVVPDTDSFPYTIRVVSEIVSSNGSTSMASVCGSTLSLMDAGVPISGPVAGISIGLVSDASRRVLLTDIQGIEDHYGDMDFKVAGTQKGVTAVQLDLKLSGLPLDVFPEALARAHTARLAILDMIEKVISAPRESLSPYAPRTLTTQIPVDKIGTVIGPGGKVIRGIQERTGTKIDIEDDGTLYVYAVDAAQGEQALQEVKDLVREVEVGEAYTGRVTRLLNFGAFVEILPGKEGLIHISQLAWERVPSVEDVVQVGDEVQVKVTDIDDQGRINLSRRDLLPRPQGRLEPAEGQGPSERRPPRRPPRGEGGGHQSRRPRRPPRE